MVPAAPIAARDVTIEPDLSNAGPFLAAALVAGGRVAIAGWPRQTTQVGDELPRLLAGFGATVTREHDHGTDTDTVVVDGGSGVRGGAALAAHDLDLTIGGELAPTIAGLAALADGAMELSGIGHLRGHETDRLAALADDLAALGGAATVLDEGLRITPQPMLAGPWRAFADHRMATTGALLGLVVDGVEVDDITSTAKTLPEFPELWSKLVASAGSPSA